MGIGGSKKSSTETWKGALLAKPKFKGTDTTALFNGLLYRMVDEATGKWAFFNNSNDYQFQIKYLFGADSDIVPLGKTTVEMQDDGMVAELVVYPLETELFVMGDVDTFESKLEALPLTEEYFAKHPHLDEQAYYRRLEAPKAEIF